MQQTVRFWWLLGGAVIGVGWVLALIGFPAAWFLGPMAVAGFAACLRPHPVRLPVGIYPASQAVIGSAISTAVTPAALGVFAHYWWGILLIIVLLMALSVINGLLLARFSQMDLPTALLGTLPGGAPGMVALSDALGADTRLVAVMQSLRLMLVVASLGLVAALILPERTSTLPGAAIAPAAGHPWSQYALTLGITGLGAWAGWRVHLPAGELAGPALLGMLSGLLGMAYAPWPPMMLDLTYALVGVAVGLQFDLPALRLTGKLLPWFIVSNLLLIGSAALIGWLLALFTSIDWFSAYLATTPGGLNMVAILALESGSNVTLVLSINLLRFLVIVLTGAPLVRGLMRYLP